MIKVKLFLYDSTKEADGYRGTDLSAYILSGAQNTENLTEELDVSEITLSGYGERAEFASETKFIVDVYENGEKVATYHRVVQEDVVEQPILSDDEYFTHSITLTEPSAIAQKRIVDNISVTYKLQDVNLETKTSFDTALESKTACDSTPPQVDRGFANYVDSTAFSDTRNISFAKYFDWKNKDGEAKIKLSYTDTNNQTVESDLYYTDLQNIKVEGGKRYASFILPTPHIMWGRKDFSGHRPPELQTPPYIDIGCASFKCTITEKNLANEVVNTYEETYISDSNFGATTDPNRNNEPVDLSFPYDFAVASYSGGKANFISERLIENIKSWVVKYGAFGATLHQEFQFSKYSDISTGIDLTNGITTLPIEINENYSYSVSLEVIIFPETNVPLTLEYDPNSIFQYSKSSYSGATFLSYCYTKLKNTQGFFNPQTSSNNTLPLARLANATYQFYGVNGPSAVIASGNPYSALSLVKRAIINSEVYYKKSGVSSVNLEENDYPFYVSDGSENEDNIVTKDDLNKIQVNEAFFHQKNLWEILLEVGKYAHAIPQINFGADEKFVISFYKLGGTNIKQNQCTRNSVMNFRKIDDYLSACSSYVDNLVQLGGHITEKIAPKSSSEDYLVRNDTAEIIVSKPIMEILHLWVSPAKTFSISGNTFTKGTKKDLAPTVKEQQENGIYGYIFEEAIYNLLSVKYNEVPNKGLALYYKLGDNEIRGGDDQLPQAVTNPYTDFSFKKIIFSAFHGYDTTYDPNLVGTGPWYDLKINDFVFEVEYRTKDTARVEHTRPDLRHYLLSTKHDKAPVHRQFNNQQDILVDSVAFGGSMFGKLIRTGNSNYQIKEWCASFSQIKHKGELYEIEGDWYYVGKVTNIFFPNHIESIVEYSKDYNQLSSIIGIPSEPRFWEISEKSNLDREVAINDYLLVTTDNTKIDTSGDYHIVNLSHTKDLIFGNGGTYLKWANTNFRGDEDLEDENVGTFGVKDFVKTVMSPINAYSCGNTLTYEWDMEDNFSAGDEVSEEVEPQNVPHVEDEAYRTMRAVQYCDKFGKSTLFDFALYGDLDFSPEQIRSLPNSPIALNISSKPPTEFDGTKTPFSRNWLVKEGTNTTVSPIDGQIYEVISYKLGTVQATTWDDNYPTIAYLDQKILQQSGSAAVDGDCVLFFLQPMSDITEVILYKRDSGSYVPTVLWDNSLGEWQDPLLVRWNETLEKYETITYETDENIVVFGENAILLKDCREVLHFNYNLMQITDSDTFVLSPFFFSDDKANSAKLVLLSEEVNKMSNGYISTNAILGENANPTITITGNRINVEIAFPGVSVEVIAAAKAVAIMEKDQSGTMQKFIIAKNGKQQGDYWYFGTPKKDEIFTRKQ